jgi:hypothetical protein
MTTTTRFKMTTTLLLLLILLANEVNNDIHSAVAAAYGKIIDYLRKMLIQRKFVAYIVETL